ncbi:MAG: SpoIVB peptidase [Defluviitaleaceae bacterium]|nr:SpoIVB peptidase [Defluviitaleaceae bacterium]
MHRKMRVIAILFFFALVGYSVGAMTYLIRFPQEIRLTEFATHSLNVGLPLSATFQGQTTMVASVNETPVTEYCSVRLGRPLLIQTDSRGTAEMTIEAFGFPLRRVVLDIVPEVEVIPLGNAIGVRINTDGVMVLGTGTFPGADGTTQAPANGLLQGGDLILRANDTVINDKEALSEYVAASTGEITFLVSRDGAEIEVTLTPAEAATDNVRRIGTWVRDSTKGIGTLTFYNPQTGTFGALGHGIVDVDTKKLMSVRSGVIMPSIVTSVKRGMRGVPGELEGDVDITQILGHISLNTANGIYGTLEPVVAEELSQFQPMPIALRAHIQEGPATILTSVAGNTVQAYSIVIESVNRFATDETKGMIIRITDPELLQITGGIVQGMSGSPILQNGRIIGAVTHVFVQDPTKGYGIFIESMLQS